MKGCCMKNEIQMSFNGESLVPFLSCIWHFVKTRCRRPKSVLYSFLQHSLSNFKLNHVCHTHLAFFYYNCCIGVEIWIKFSHETSKKKKLNLTLKQLTTVLLVSTQYDISKNQRIVFLCGDFFFYKESREISDLNEWLDMNSYLHWYCGSSSLGEMPEWKQLFICWMFFSAVHKKGSEWWMVW